MTYWVLSIQRCFVRHRIIHTAVALKSYCAEAIQPKDILFTRFVWGNGQLMREKKKTACIIVIAPRDYKWRKSKSDNSNGRILCNLWHADCGWKQCDDVNRNWQAATAFTPNNKKNVNKIIYHAMEKYVILIVKSAKKKLSSQSDRTVNGQGVWVAKIFPMLEIETDRSNLCAIHESWGNESLTTSTCEDIFFGNSVQHPSEWRIVVATMAHHYYLILFALTSQQVLKHWLQ